MLDIDFNARIRAIRSTFADIATVMDLPGLESRIAELEEQAAAPGLWDDPDAAQKVTSSLSHSKSRFTKLSAVRQRLDDLDVLFDGLRRAIAAQVRHRLEDLGGHSDHRQLPHQKAVSRQFEDRRVKLDVGLYILRLGPRLHRAALMLDDLE